MSSSGNMKVNESMLDLFKIEVENHAGSMMDILLNFEGSEDRSTDLEKLMRFAHSIKGAAKLVNVNSAVQLAHIMEDAFVAAQNGQLHFTSTDIDHFIASIDLLNKLSTFTADQHENPSNDFSHELDELITQISNMLNNDANSLSENASTASQTATHSKKTITFEISETIDSTMLDLFKTELENNIEILANDLLAAEENPDESSHLEKLMRASHSIKGAAKLVGIDPVVKLAHAMEDCFVAAQNDIVKFNENSTDVILNCIDILKSISLLTSVEYASWTKNNSGTLSNLINSLDAIKNNTQPPVSDTSEKTQNTETRNKPSAPKSSIKAANEPQKEPDSVVRVSAKRINRLLGLAGELSVTSSWIRNYSSSMMALKKKHNDIIDAIDRLRTIMEESPITDLEKDLISNIQIKAEDYRDSLTTEILHLDEFDRRSSDLTGRLNHEIISSRMRPFKDATQGYKRMVRDISKSLNKKVRLIIAGEDTQVDRDILEKIEAPINHMIRNAIDHGVESPDERLTLGKNEYGTIRLEATHNAGMLLITVEDDGRGVDIEKIRTKVLERNLVNKSMADNLSKSELLELSFSSRFLNAR